MTDVKDATTPVARFTSSVGSPWRRTLPWGGLALLYTQTGRVLRSLR